MTQAATAGGNHFSIHNFFSGRLLLMKARGVQQQLNRAERDDLSDFLATTPGAMPFLEAHGFLTAIVSAPTTIMPSIWQPEMLGERRFSSMEQAQHVLGLVMRLYNQIVTDLNAGQQITPSDADDDDIELWCAGYLHAAHMDDVWLADERGTLFLFPMAVLAGEVDLVGEQDSAGNVIKDPAPQVRRCRDALDETVHEANQYWTAWRRKSVAAPIASRSQKVGRNEPCPCGSGLKFKKCCALKEH